MKQKTICLADPSICTGCGACVSVCPKACIQMMQDKEGFLQPQIDIIACIECHKCEKTCPIINPKPISTEFKTQAYSAINKNENIRMQSSSGGAFYALAKWIIEQDGVVFGARWDENWEVMHDYAEDLDGVRAFMRSKYVQSKVGVTYEQAKKFLQQDRWVLYSGTPCQLAGLNAFLGGDYPKLLQVDLICHGVPSPKVWRSYLECYLKDEKIIDINMRDKTNGWMSEMFTLKTSSATQSVGLINNPYYKGFGHSVYLRLSCYNCHFRTFHRNSDITLADYWGVDEFNPKMYDNKGTSIILIHSNKGYTIINLLAEKFILCSEKKEDILYYNRSANGLNPIPNKWKRYFRWFRLFSFKGAKHVIDRDTIPTIIIRKCKKIKKRLGIYNKCAKKT